MVIARVARVVAWLLACGATAGCTLLLSADRRRGEADAGQGPLDAARGDAAIPDDAGVDATLPPSDAGAGTEDAGTDAGPDPCDVDGDGHLAEITACDARRMGAAADCDDARAEVYPGALPICGSGRIENCENADAIDARTLLGDAAELGFAAPYVIRQAGATFGPEVALSVGPRGDAHLAWVVRLSDDTSHVVIRRFAVGQPDVYEEIRSTVFGPALARPTSVAIRALPDGSAALFVLASDAAGFPGTLGFAGTVLASRPLEVELQSLDVTSGPIPAWIGRASIVGGGTTSSGAPIPLRYTFRELRGGAVYAASIARDGGTLPAVTFPLTGLSGMHLGEPRDAYGSLGSIELVHDPEGVELTSILDHEEARFAEYPASFFFPMVAGRMAHVWLSDETYAFVATADDALYLGSTSDGYAAPETLGVAPFSTGAAALGLPTIDGLRDPVEILVVSARYDEADGSSVVARFFGPGLVPVRTSDCCGDRPLLDFRATRRRLTDLQSGAYQAGGDTTYLVAAVTRASTATEPDEIVIGALRACRAE